MFVQKLMADRSHRFFKGVLIFFLITYIFCAMTNMFLLRHNTGTFSKAFRFTHLSNRRNILNPNNSEIGLIRIIDKSVLDDDQYNLIKSAAVFYLIIFIACGFFKKKSLSISPQTNTFNTVQHTYLSFCKLRI